MSELAYRQYDLRRFQTDDDQGATSSQEGSGLTGRAGYDTVLIHILSAALAAMGAADLRTLLDVSWSRSTSRGPRRGAWWKRAADGLVLSLSLPSVLYSANVSPLALGDVTAALYRVADVLRISAEEVLGARLYRVDLAANLALTRPPALYLPTLLHLPRARRYPFSASSLAFINKTRTLLFYDKARQLAATGRAVPGPLLDRNVLRYELQTKRALTALLAPVLGPAPVASDLASPAVYRLLVGEWATRYRAVATARPVALGSPTGIRSLNRSLARVGVAALGATEVIAALDALRGVGAVSGDMRGRMRRHVLDLAAEGAPDAPDLAAEFTVAVEAAVNHSLNLIS